MLATNVFKIIIFYTQLCMLHLFYYLKLLYSQDLFFKDYFKIKQSSISWKLSLNLDSCIENIKLKIIIGNLLECIKKYL